MSPELKGSHRFAIQSRLRRLVAFGSVQWTKISRGHPHRGFQLFAFCFALCDLRTRSVRNISRGHPRRGFQLYSLYFMLYSLKIHESEGSFSIYHLPFPISTLHSLIYTLLCTLNFALCVNVGTIPLSCLLKLKYNFIN